MKKIAPEYYQEFHCIADRCTHSCCIGWEIDINSETYKKYMELTVPFKERLEKEILSDGDTFCFRLDKDDRCPFLCRNGLCEIILTLGEEYLSQICSDHPRFRNFYGDCEEIGVGLACEEAARLILFGERMPSLILLNSDGKETVCTDFEVELLQKRERVFSLISAENTDFKACTREIFNVFSLKNDEKSLAEYIPLFECLEKMDKTWTGKLCLLKSLSEDTVISAEKKYSDVLKRLLHYFFYRHLTNAKDAVEMRACAAFCILSTRIVAGLFALQEEEGETSPASLVECARMYSAEIEYSEDNTEEILAEFSFDL